MASLVPLASGAAGRGADAARGGADAACGGAGAAREGSVAVVTLRFHAYN